MVFLSQIIKDFQVGWVHNPDEFHQGSFWTELEYGSDGKQRLVLYGRNKRNKKNPGKVRKVAILKKKNYYVNIFGEKVMK